MSIIDASNVTYSNSAGFLLSKDLQGAMDETVSTLKDMIVWDGTNLVLKTFKIPTHELYYIQDGALQKTYTTSKSGTGTSVSLKAYTGYQAFKATAVDGYSNNSYLKFEKIDLTPYSKYVVVWAGSFDNGTLTSGNIGVFSNSASGGWETKKSCGNTSGSASTIRTTTIDISSLTGEYAVGVHCYAREGNNSATMKLYNIYVV